jgi:hypothetical protein
VLQASSHTRSNYIVRGQGWSMEKINASDGLLARAYI